MTLVERWRPETHMFHLPCWEVSIKLQNVVVQLELSIDGDAMTGRGKLVDPYERLLGKVPQTMTMKD